MGFRVLGFGFRFLITVLVSISGHVRGLSVGHKYGYIWLRSTMNLQAGALRAWGISGFRFVVCFIFIIFFWGGGLGLFRAF